MIVTKTPLRISFFGGGSDIPAYYETGNNEGVCLSTTIDSYIYLAVNRCVADHVKVVYSDMELVKTAREVRHDRVRNTLDYYGITSNIEICSFSDIPTKGTGLGSSSAFTVGLINAVSDYEMDRWNLADMACHIEIGMCREPIGKQDQYASSYGGLNMYTFTRDNVHVEPIQIPRSTANEFNRRLLFFDTGLSRDASSVLLTQVKNLQDGFASQNTTTQLVDMAHSAKKLLQRGMIDDVGYMLGAAWEKKKSLAPNISNPIIDEMFEECMRLGALGGKLLGAGNGGYLMMYVPPHMQASIIERLSQYKMRKFAFSYTGSTRSKI